MVLLNSKAACYSGDLLRAKYGVEKFMDCNKNSVCHADIVSKSSC